MRGTTGDLNAKAARHVRRLPCTYVAVVIGVAAVVFGVGSVQVTGAERARKREGREEEEREQKRTVSSISSCFVSPASLIAIPIPGRTPSIHACACWREEAHFVRTVARNFGNTKQIPSREVISYFENITG